MLNNATAELIAKLCETASRCDPYGRKEILMYVDKLIIIYEKERLESTSIGQ